uniref:histidine kinase n=1 Tax=Magnetococcus massalia (strain MO-1) TaxID=451514 RepID=A0A1S7LJQ5_MAGMO|nr:Putative histidine kinase with HAMP domain, GAF domain, KisKA domain, HATPase domain and three response regulator receiver domains [Candidatus Magnetococcus massalia]
MLFDMKKISNRMGWGFGLMIMLMIGVSVLALYYMESLSSQTANLYRHPFAVTNAILRLEGNIIRMHRSMKDVTLAHNSESMQASIHKVDELEKAVFHDLQIVQERFLGEQHRVDELRFAIRNWKPIRDEVIRQTERGKHATAAKITQGKGAIYVADLIKQIDGFVDFAHNKAESFFSQAQSDRKSALRYTTIVLVASVLLGIAMTLLNIRAILGPINRLMSATHAITQGDLSARVGDLGGGELGQLAHAFDQMAAQNEQQNWLGTISAELSTQIQKTNTLQELAETIIQQLPLLLKAGHGAIYMLEDEEEAQHYTLFSSYAFQQRKNLSNRYAPGEGLVGQCVREKSAIVLTHVPADYIQISSGLGEATPMSILVQPIIAQEKVLAVIELASFLPFTEAHRILLEEISLSLGLTMENRRRAHRTEELLQKTQMQSEELAAQQEELRQTNDALLKQAESLKTSEEELRAQQERLQETNTDLEDRTEKLMEEQQAREAASRALEVKAEELELASRYKSEFLANMSHELRTPLNSLLILARSFATNQDGNLTDDQVEAAKIIHGSGQDLLKLINDILDLAKIESGRIELINETFSLETFSRLMRNQFQHVAQDRGVEFAIQLSPNLPATITTDEDKLGQIIKNLLSNAFKFTSDGAVELAFMVANEVSQPVMPAEIPPDALAVVVSDQGIGIPQDKQRIIFEAFQQVDGTTSRQYGGTGLGLAISRQLTLALGGRLSLHSEEDQGSTFALFLPFSHAEATTPDITKAVQIPAAKREAPKPAPVVNTPPAAQYIPQHSVAVDDDRDALDGQIPALLIIEDDLGFAQVLRSTFRQKGYPCLIALDGQSGVALAKNYRPAGIILDLGLPDMDGWSVLDRLKNDSDTRHIPVHIISGRDKQTDGMQKGAVGFFSKPVSGEDLDEALVRIRHFTSDEMRNLLIVEDDPNAAQALVHLLNSETVSITLAETGKEALKQLETQTFDCMILDLVLPDISGFEVLEQLSNYEALSKPPVIIHSGKQLTREEHEQLQHYTDSIIIKGAQSPERLLDEVVLFLHSVEEKLPEEQRKLLSRIHDPETVFQDKTILLVDDDVRNTFALARTLEQQGLRVLMAPSGQKALETLQGDTEINLVLMDIMMPGMDGYQTMQEIRKQPEFQRLPIIAVTAKAMLEDRQKCLAAGANDYLAKPVDVDRLFSMMRVWLYH